MKTPIIIVALLLSQIGAEETKKGAEVLYASGNFFSNKSSSEYFTRSIRKFDQFYLINGKQTEATLKSVADNHFVIETKSGKIITPKKGYFDKVISKNGELVFSRPNLNKSVSLLEGALSQPSPPSQKKVTGLPVPEENKPRVSESLSFIRFGLMMASIGAGIYSIVSYQKGDEIYNKDYQQATTGNSADKYEREVKSYDDKANIAMGISGGLLIMGLVSFAF